MKRLSFVMLVATGVSLLAVSCKQGDRTDVLAPKDAAMVVHLNNSSLSSKLSWNEIKATRWFKDLYAKSNDSLFRKILDNPDNSGIDVSADMLIFMKKEGRGSYLAFAGTLKDPNAFENFNVKINEGGEPAHDGEAHVFEMKDHVVARWEGTRFVYIANMPTPPAMRGRTSYNPDDFSSGFEEPYSFPADSLKILAKNTLAIKGDVSIGSDKRYNELIKEAGDVHIWVNNDQYLANLGVGGEIAGLMKIGDLMKGNASASTISFDNGKITMKSKQYLNDQLAALFKKYPAKKISADVINRIPSQNVIGVIAMNYPPEGLKELIKLTGFDGMINGELAKAGYSIEEFVKANKGDLVLAVSDLERKKEMVKMDEDFGGGTREVNKTDFKVLFATSVNDKAAFDKLITTAMSTLPADERVTKQVSYKVDKNWFVASNSAEFVDKFIAGASTTQPFVNKLEGQSFGMYVDLQKLIRAMGDGGSNTEFSDASLKLWQDIVVTSGGYNDKTASSYAEINMIDKSTNSLKQLNQYLDTMKAIDDKRRDYNAMGADTVMPVAPPAPEAPVAPKPKN